MKEFLDLINQPIWLFAIFITSSVSGFLTMELYDRWRRR